MSDAATPNLPSRDFKDTSEFFLRLGFVDVWRDDGWLILKRGGITLEFFPLPRFRPCSEQFQLLSSIGRYGFFLSGL